MRIPKICLGKSRRRGEAPAESLAELESVTSTASRYEDQLQTVVTWVRGAHSSNWVLGKDAQPGGARVNRCELEQHQIYE
jgi:hypothetical protein